VSQGVEVWSSAAWRGEATDWLDEQLTAAGTKRIGEVTQPRLRPWGTVLKALTPQGPVWLKAPGPQTVFEVGLYQLLQRVAPDQVLHPLAVDLERGWVLLPDGGATLGDQVDRADLVEAMVKVLPDYGRLQLDLGSHVDSLLALGVADMRAQVMPQRFEEALEVAGRFVGRYGDDADREVLRRLGDLRSTVAGWCDQLSGATLAPSLDHNDLHPWNIFGDGSGPARFYDWGDSVVAHPLSSMLVCLGFLREQVGMDEQALRRPRDAYLEVFGPTAGLIEEMELACRVGKVARALTWERAIRTQTHEEAGAFARAPLETLESLLRHDSSPDLR